MTKIKTKRKAQRCKRSISKLSTCIQLSREVSAIKNKLSAHFGYLMTQAARVKDEVSNSAKVKAIKQKVSDGVADYFG